MTIQKIQNKGIQYKCGKCNKIVEFPFIEDIENKFSNMCFSVYTIAANNHKYCFECRNG